MKIFKNLICTILSFVLSLIVIIYMILNILNNNILNKKYILSKLEETEFYLQISREVESGFENYIYQSGLPEDTIKDLFSKDMIKADVKSIVDYVYDGTEITSSYETLRENLNTRVQNYINSQGIALSQQGQENVTKFEDLIVNEYKDNINVSDTLYNAAHSSIQKLTILSEKVGDYPLIIIAIIIISIILLNIDNLLSAINYIAISFLTVGILIKLAVKLIFEKVDIDNLVILTTSITNLVINCVKEILYKFDDNSMAFIICSIIAIFIVAILKNEKVVEKIRKPKRRHK